MSKRRPITDLIVEDALENLKDTWRDYANGGLFNFTSFDDVLDAMHDYKQALQMRNDIRNCTQ